MDSRNQRLSKTMLAGVGWVGREGGGGGSPSAQDPMRWFAQMRTGVGSKVEQGVSQPSQQRCVRGEG